MPFVGSYIFSVSLAHYAMANMLILFDTLLDVWQIVSYELMEMLGCVRPPGARDA